ncbi:RNA polymerase sigma factor [Chitinophaga sp. 30R24]|uniref:RNA polymerase sigma factor n=1 Tax=Chitinophaga sp. 30R24 TaxID=3248838 RepID=UPI003B8FA766
MPGELYEWSDEALFLRFQDGDTAPFEEIYRRFSGLLYLHAYRMLANEADAQDIVQEVFTTVWTKGKEVKLTVSLAAWLFVVTRNKVLNLIARQRSYQQHLSNFRQFISETDTSTLSQLTEKELLAIIEQEIQLLPAKMREVFELSRKASLSHKEIAQQLQLSPETVKKQVSNAIRTLKHKVAHFIFCVIW